MNKRDHGNAVAGPRQNKPRLSRSLHPKMALRNLRKGGGGLRRVNKMQQQTLGIRPSKGPRTLDGRRKAPLKIP